jgi:uncharacterized membrane protein YbhN (UPF0104 family)
VTTWRWAIVLDSMRPPFAFSTACRILFTSQFFAQVLPSAIGGDVLRMWYTRREGVPTGIAVSSIIIERVAGLGAIALLVVVMLPVLFLSVTDVNQRIYLLVCLGLVVVGIAFLFSLAFIPNRYHHLRIIRFAVDLGRHAMQIATSPRLCWRVLLISIAGQIALSIAAYVLCRGVGSSVSLLSCILLIPPTLLLTAFPISIAGWGIREGAMVLSLGIAGVPVDAALVVSLIYGMLSSMTGLPGFFLWLVNRRELAEANADLAESKSSTLR